jgi:hypothetical protein
MFKSQHAISLISLGFFFLAGPLEADEAVWGLFARRQGSAQSSGGSDVLETIRCVGFCECPSPDEPCIKDPTVDAALPRTVSRMSLSHILSS